MKAGRFAVAHGYEAVRCDRLADIAFLRDYCRLFRVFVRMLKIVWCRASRRSPVVVPKQCDPQFISAVAH